MQLNVQKGTNINEVNVRKVTFCKQELNKDRDSLGRNTSSDFRGLGRVVVSRAKAAPAKRSEKVYGVENGTTLYQHPLENTQI